MDCERPEMDSILLSRTPGWSGARSRKVAAPGRIRPFAAKHGYSFSSGPMTEVQMAYPFAFMWSLSGR